MIAAERQKEGAAVEDDICLSFDSGRRVLMIAIVEQAIAVVDHGHFGEEIAVEGILRIIVEDRRSAADRLRPETCARPVRCGGIEGDAPDGDVDAGELLGEAAAHVVESCR